MQSTVENHEAPKEEAAVMPVRGLRKWCGDWNLSAGRHQKPKGRIQASCVSRKRLTVAGRTCCVGVTWLRRGIIRKDCTRPKFEQATQRVGPLRKNLRTHHERKRGTKDPGGDCYMWDRRGQLRLVSEGGAQDSCHLWEEEDRPTRPSRRPSSWNLWSKQTECPAGFGKWGNGPCGEVSPLQNGKWSCTE
jgi:hypothetical protein